MNLRNITFLIVMAIMVVACKSDNNQVLGYNYNITKSTGDKKPMAEDYVYFALTITDEKDSILQAMTEEPQLPLLQIPKEGEALGPPNPVAELLKQLSLGDEATLIMPIDSFKNSAIDLSKYKEILYKIEVRNILSPEEFQAENEAKQADLVAKTAETQKLLPEITQSVEDFLKEVKSGKAKLETTANGLKYQIIEEGDGEKLESGARAGIHYYGALMDGTPFDNSYRRGEPYKLTVDRGEVIAGWDQGLQLLNRGGKAFIVIPADLAYGATGSGSIPPGAEIMFYVHVAE